MVITKKNTHYIHTIHTTHTHTQKKMSGIPKIAFLQLGEQLMKQQGTGSGTTSTCAPRVMQHVRPPHHQRSQVHSSGTLEERKNTIAMLLILSQI